MVYRDLSISNQTIRFLPPLYMNPTGVQVHYKQDQQKELVILHTIFAIGLLSAENYTEKKKVRVIRIMTCFIFH